MATYKATRVYEIGGKKYRAWQDTMMGHWHLYDAKYGDLVAHYVSADQLEASITHMIQQSQPDYGIW